MLPQVTPPKGGLYIIWLSDTHFYGGRAVNFGKRWAAHLSYLKAGTHNNRYMQRVFDKHGQFRPVIVMEIPAGQNHLRAEQAWLDEHYGKPGVVNLSSSAEGSFSGRVWINDGETNRRVLPDEVEAHIAAGWLHGRKPRPAGAPHGNNGRVRSLAEMEAAKVAGLKRQGRSRSPEAIAKTAAGNTGRKNGLEAQANLKAAGELRRGMSRDPDLMLRIGEKNRGRKHTPEVIAQMSRAKARPVDGVLPPDGICTSNFEMLRLFHVEDAISVNMLSRLCPHLGVSSLRQRLFRCKAAGLVKSHARGLYRLTHVARDVLRLVSAHV